MSIQIFQTREDFKNANLNASIGFIPTMGNLHDGHLSLLKKSLDENIVTVISIFVNPTQFAPGEDFGSYPRTFDQDLNKIELLGAKYPQKTIIVFYPKDENVIYQASSSEIEYDPGPVQSILEGELRPTFFKGVTMVVKRLFEIVHPTNAYFGQKDYQQLFIIKKMVKDLKLPINIVSMPIIREIDGLAMSSRNQYLNTAEKKDALKVSKTLQQISELCKQNLNLAQDLVTKITKEDKFWNYLTLRNTNDLGPATQGNEVVILANYQMGKTRLLDNMVVKFNEF